MMPGPKASAPGPQALAATFLANHDGASWREHFDRWAQARGLPEHEQREVRVEILRRRAFGAAIAGTARAARRRIA